MSFANAAENDLMLLLLNNTAWANVGNAGGLQPSSVAGSLFTSLHTASVGQAGNQQTSEAAYNGYARVGIARSGAGFTVSGSNPTQGVNAVAVTYATANATGTPETEADFAVGTLSSGAGEVLWYGTLTASLIVNPGITPSYAIGALVLKAQ